MTGKLYRMGNKGPLFRVVSQTAHPPVTTFEVEGEAKPRRMPTSAFRSQYMRQAHEVDAAAEYPEIMAPRRVDVQFPGRVAGHSPVLKGGLQIQATTGTGLGDKVVPTHNDEVGEGHPEFNPGYGIVEDEWEDEEYGEGTILKVRWDDGMVEEINAADVRPYTAPPATTGMCDDEDKKVEGDQNTIWDQPGGGDYQAHEDAKAVNWQNRAQRRQAGTNWQMYTYTGSRADAEAGWRQQQSSDQSMYGMDPYSGTTAAMPEGIIWQNQTFETVEEADEWLFGNTEKWGPAMGVAAKENGKDVWVVGGRAPS